MQQRTCKPQPNYWQRQMGGFKVIFSDLSRYRIAQKILKNTQNSNSTTNKDRQTGLNSTSRFVQLTQRIAQKIVEKLLLKISGKVKRLLLEIIPPLWRLLLPGYSQWVELFTPLRRAAFKNNSHFRKKIFLLKIKTSNIDTRVENYKLKRLVRLNVAFMANFNE